MADSTTDSTSNSTGAPTNTASILPLNEAEAAEYIKSIENQLGDFWKQQSSEVRNQPVQSFEIVMVGLDT